MAGRIQDADVKDATEAGAASRLINDTKIYVTGSALNKTLFQAIDDGDLGAGSSTGLTLTAVKTANYTASVNELVLCNASGGAFTVTFPTASGNTNKRIGVKKVVADTTLTAITIDGNGSETLDGELTRLVHTAGEYWEFSSNGTNWIREVHNSNTAWSSATNLTPTAVTTNPTLTTGVSYNIFQWRREGSNMHYKYDIKVVNGGGSNGSGIYKLPLPSGATINTTDVRVMVYISGNTLYDEGSVLGKCILKNSATVNNAYGLVYAFDSTNLAVGGVNFNNVWNSGFVGLNNGAGTISVGLQAVVPISGWEA